MEKILDFTTLQGRQYAENCGLIEILEISDDGRVFGWDKIFCKPFPMMNLISTNMFHRIVTTRRERWDKNGS